jgi:hypothetical protein
MPTGTFTRLILIVGIVADNVGSTGPDATQPIAVSTAGWTLLRSVNDGVTPGFAVFSPAGGAAPPAVAAQNLTNGRLTGAVLGWTSGTTVTTSLIASGVAPATSLSVASTTAPTPTTWIFAGSASDGSDANNWSPSRRAPGARCSFPMCRATTTRPRTCTSHATRRCRPRPSV